MEIEVEPIYFSFPKTRVTKPDRGSAGTREINIGDVKKSSGLSYTANE